MSDSILNLLKNDMNGLSIQDIRKEIPGVTLSDMKVLTDSGKVKFSHGLYKAEPSAWN